MKGREPEFCDDCRERVGYYDPSLPDGEKIVLTRKCWCVREREQRKKVKKGLDFQVI